MKTKSISLIEVLIATVIMLVFFSPVLMVFRNVKSSEIDTQKTGEITFIAMSIFEILKSTPYKDIRVGKFNVNEDYIIKHLHSTYDEKQVLTFQNYLDYFLYIAQSRKISGQIQVEEVEDAFGTVKIARLNVAFIPSALKNTPDLKERAYRFNFIFNEKSI